MPNQLALRRGARLARRDSDIESTYDAIGTRASLELARIRGIEAVEAAKIDAIGAVGRVGLLEVANVSAVELVLFQQTPHAGPRLQRVADSAANSIAGVITKLDRRLS
jgi:hypothetical protein